MAYTFTENIIIRYYIDNVIPANTGWYIWNRQSDGTYLRADRAVEVNYEGDTVIQIHSDYQNLQDEVYGGSGNDTLVVQHTVSGDFTIAADETDTVLFDDGFVATAVSFEIVSNAYMIDISYGDDGHGNPYLLLLKAAAETKIQIGGADAITAKTLAEDSSYTNGFGTPLNTAPVLTQTGTQIAINEGDVGASDLETGYTFSATDADGDPITYGVNDGRFSVNSESKLVVKANTVFDYETEASVDLTVTANDGTADSNAVTVTVAISDVSEGIGSFVTVDDGSDSYTVGTKPGKLGFYLYRDGNGNLEASKTSQGNADRIIVQIKDGVTLDPLPTIAFQKVATSVDYFKFSFLNSLSISIHPENTSLTLQGLLDLFTDSSANTADYFDISLADGVSGSELAGQLSPTTAVDVPDRAFGVGQPSLVANAAADTTISGGDVVYKFEASDPDGDTVNYSISSGNDDGNFAIATDSNGVATVTLVDGKTLTEGDYVFDVTASSRHDDDSSNPEETVTVTVTLSVQTPPNTAPVLAISGSQIAINEGDVGVSDLETGYTFSTTDADGDSITYRVNDSRFDVTSEGKLVVKANTVFDYETEASIDLTVTANDGKVDSNSIDVTVAVTNLNDHDPVLASSGTASSSLLEGSFDTETETGLIFTATDADGDLNSVTISVDDRRFDITSEGKLVILANTSFDHEAGDDSLSLTITASDGTNSDTETVTLAFGNVNDNAPVLVQTGTSQNVINEGDVGDTDLETGYTFSATDADNDPVTYSVNDDRFSVNSEGKLIVKAGMSFDYEIEASIDLSVTANDGTADSNAINVTVAITNLNDNAPELALGSIYANKTGVQVLSSTDIAITDADDIVIADDSQVFTLTDLGGMAWAHDGTALSVNDTFTLKDVKDGLITYGFNASGTFTAQLTVSDGVHASAVADFKVFARKDAALPDGQTVDDSNTVDYSSSTENLMIVTGAGWDTIQSGMGSDYIYAGTGNDYITLADDDLQDEIVYYFGKSSVSDGYRAADSGNKVRGFERGIDVLTLKVAADSGVTSTTLEEFLESNTGADGIKGNADDPFHVKFNFASDGNGGVEITGLVFAFTGGGTDASGRLGNAYFDIYFDNPMPLTTFLERVGKTDEIHAGAHEINTNINPGFGSIIDLKKLDEIFGEDGLRFIPDAAPSPLFSTPSTALNGDAGNNNLSGTSADEMIQGGDGNDTITTGGGDDVIIGGAGDDTITLGAGSDTIIYRFESGDDGWTGTDGADTINNFNPNEDKFYFIDTNISDPITSFAALAAAAGKPAVTLTHPNTGVSFDYGLTSVTLTFDGGDDDATNDKVLSINFTDSYDGGIDQSNVTVIKGSDEYPETSQLDNYLFFNNVSADSDALAFIELSDLPDGLVIL